MTLTGVANERAAAALIDELWRAGVRDICISPGGRSTPLALALARDPRLRSWMITDERSSAFFALGAAIASGRPTAIVCTSGTAAANFLPAVVEAFSAEVPLIVLTADRPPELRECGAAQTIRQPQLFGRHVKWETELVPPGGDSPGEEHARAVACRAVGIARSEPAGPVHVNVPYREPLVAEQPWLEPDAVPPDLAPFTTVTQPHLVADEAALTAFVDRARTARGMVVCGPRLAASVAEPVVALAATLDWPVLADPLSGVRHGPHDRTRVIDAHDLLLRDSGFCATHRPDVVLRFGAVPTSKPLNRFLADSRADQVLVTTATAWPDPEFRLRHVILGDAADFCRRARHRLAAGVATDAAWCGRWREASAAVRRRLDALLARETGIIDGGLAARLIDRLPDGALLLVGNSMPVRDIDTFAGSSGKRLRILANRGANGIDGVVSTALGMAAAHAGPGYLLIGDLSLLHDIGALQIAARHRLDLCIVVANNDGGGIFSWLPQAGLGDAFEPYFGTPHGLGFADAARMCGIAHHPIATLDDLDAMLAPRPGVRLLEVPTRREHNVARSRALVAEALGALRDAAEPGTA